MVVLRINVRGMPDYVVRARYATAGAQSLTFESQKMGDPFGRHFRLLANRISGVDRHLKSKKSRKNILAEGSRVPVCKKPCVCKRGGVCLWT